MATIVSRHWRKRDCDLRFILMVQPLIIQHNMYYIICYTAQNTPDGMIKYQ